MNVLQRILPHWLNPYPKQHLSGDVLAGIITTVLVLPQSLAYALLAGLPPQAGLVASVLPTMIYALLGSSMVQAVGPVAVTAILTFSVLSPLAVPGTAHYIELAAALALMSGLLVVAFGFLRLGFLSDLLSRPVVSGFISGSAVLILISQLRLLIGVQAHGADSWHLLEATLAALPSLHWPTALMGFCGLVMLLFCRHALGNMVVRLGLAPRRADFLVRVMPLVIVVVATAAVHLWDLDTRHGIAVVGTVQQGFALPALFLPDRAALQALAIPALLLAFIGTVQNIAMAQALAVRRRERIDTNQELIGLGAANVAAAFSGGMPVGGGVTRTAVNLAAGAQTPLASLVAGLVMLLILMVGTEAFTRLPLAILAASIVVASFSMVDMGAFRRAWNYDRADAIALAGTALGVLVLGLQTGIALGIGLSLAVLLFRTTTPHIAVVGRIEGTEHFRSVERHGVQTLPGVLFLRVDESLFFGNLRAVEQRISTELELAPQTHDMVLIMSAVNRIDLTALESLQDLNRDLIDRHICLHLAEVKGPVQDRIAGTELSRSLSGGFYRSAHDAFEVLRQQPSA
jgi:SulP family sulfate permease